MHLILDVGSRIPSWPAATSAPQLDTAVAASSERHEKEKSICCFLFVLNHSASVFKCSFENFSPRPQVMIDEYIRL